MFLFCKHRLVFTAHFFLLKILGYLFHAYFSPVLYVFNLIHKFESRTLRSVYTPAAGDRMACGGLFKIYYVHKCGYINFGGT